MSSPKKERKSVVIANYASVKKLLSDEDRARSKVGADPFDGLLQEVLEAKDLTKLTKASDAVVGDILEATLLYNCFHKLMQLGFSGTLVTQRIFASALAKLIDLNDPRDVSFNLFNSAVKGTESETIDGTILLQRLIWCEELEDSVTKQNAKSALRAITANLASECPVLLHPSISSKP